MTSDFSSRAEAIRSRCEAATPGPWEATNERWNGNWKDHIERGHSIFAPGREIHVAETWADFEEDDDPIHVESTANADFIAHSRTDLPDALAEIARLTAQVEMLQGGHRAVP